MALGLIQATVSQFGMPAMRNCDPNEIREIDRLINRSRMAPRLIRASVLGFTAMRQRLTPMPALHIPGAAAAKQQTDQQQQAFHQPSQ